MTASIVQIAKQVVASKNANASLAGSTAGQYGFVLNDSRRSLWEIVGAILQADDETVLDILDTYGHWARADYLADSATIFHGGEIPQHQGEIGKVLIQRSSGASFLPARGRLSASEVERYRANTGVSPTDIYGKTAHTDPGSPLSGYFDISEEDLLFYTGYSAKVEVANVARAVKNLTDLTTTSGSKNVGSAQLDSPDAGSILVALGAGAGGADFASEIKTASIGVGTIADNAGASLAGNGIALIARCQSPAAYQSLVTARALTKLYKEGDDPNLLSIWQRQAEVLAGKVKANARQLPDVVQAERAA